MTWSALIVTLFSLAGITDCPEGDNAAFGIDDICVVATQTPTWTVAPPVTPMNSTGRTRSKSSSSTTPVDADTLIKRISNGF